MEMVCVIKCGLDYVVKHESGQSLPQHSCKACGDQLTKNPVHGYQKYPLQITLPAAWFYSRGLSMRRISHLCQCVTQSVLNGVRDEAREQYEHPAPAGHAVLLEVDDVWQYLKKSPEHDGSGKRLSVIRDHCLPGNVGLRINTHSRNCPNDERSETGTYMVLMNSQSIVRSFLKDGSS
jgi:transposase